MEGIIHAESHLKENGFDIMKLEDFVKTTCWGFIQTKTRKISLYGGDPVVGCVLRTKMRDYFENNNYTAEVSLKKDFCKEGCSLHVGTYERLFFA